MLLARTKSTASDTGPRPHRRSSVENRFFRFVLQKPKNPRECWVWYGHLSHDGRPLIWGGVDNPKQVYATRLSYEIYKGEIPDGHVVSPTCENKKCVNPVHLICGPRGEIMGRQMRLSRRTAKFGEENNASILTNAEVTHIRQLHSERKFKDIHAIAQAKGMNNDYVVSVGRGRGRLRKPSKGTNRILPVTASHVSSTHRSR